MDGGTKFANDSALQLTLRQMRVVFTSPRTLGGLAVVALILGISGPFQTFDLFPLGWRLVYWAVVATSTFAVASFFATWASHVLERKNWPISLRFALTGFASALPVALVVSLINAATLSLEVMDPAFMALLGLYSAVIAFVIPVLFFLFSREPVDQAPPKPAQILRRLPVHFRGKLMSLSVQDHYVEVTTTKGKHMVLLRLSDAIRETGGVRGLQIHRSHWVALGAIEKVQRQNSKLVITTRNGASFPVSRTYVSKVRDAGLLV